MEKAGTSAVSQSELDSAKAAYLSALGNYEKAKAQKQTAQTNLEYTYLKAPFDGTLGNIALSLGDYISPADRNLMQLVQYSPIRVVFSVSDKEYLKHFQKDKAANLVLHLRLANGELLSEAGAIKYAANTIDKPTDSLAIYAEFDNFERKLLPNAYVEVLLEKTFENVWLVPKSNVLLQPDGDFIYAIHHNILQTRQIDILGEYENQYVAKDDFLPDEFWVTEDVNPNFLNQKVGIKSAVATSALEP
jgi:membrane fusion protein (multidrug efflux system)